MKKVQIFLCMGKIFCVEFHNVPLKFNTEWFTQTFKDAIYYIVEFLRALTFKRSQAFLKRPQPSTPTATPSPSQKRLPFRNHNFHACIRRDLYNDYFRKILWRLFFYIIFAIGNCVNISLDGGLVPSVNKPSRLVTPYCGIDLDQHTYQVITWTCWLITNEASWKCSIYIITLTS